MYMDLRIDAPAIKSLRIYIFLYNRNVYSTIAINVNNPASSF